MRALLLCLTLAAAAGCSRQAPVNERAEVEKAIQEYVNSRPSLSPETMSMEVQQVSFQGDRAEATVQFRSKHDLRSGVAMLYVLKRTGSRSWMVERDKTKAIHPPTPGPAEGAPQK